MRYRKLKGYKYMLVDDYRVALQFHYGREIITGYIEIHGNIMLIKAGYCWDGPSGPTFDTANFMRGSLIHDALYQLIREGHIKQALRKRADMELRYCCLEDGMSRIRAWWVYHGVRSIFGHLAAQPKKRPRGQIIKLVMVDGKMQRIAA